MTCRCLPTWFGYSDEGDLRGVVAGSGEPDSGVRVSLSFVYLLQLLFELRSDIAFS